MKVPLVSLAVLGLVVLLSPGVHAQPNGLDDVIIFENFDSATPGLLPSGWTQVSLDSGNSPIFYGHPSIWQVFSRTGFPTYSGPCVVACAYNSDSSPNNDWLIMPRENLTGTISLSYWVSSQDPQNPESFEIRVSTGGNQPASFTRLVATITNAPRTWTLHTHDLSQFVGAPFYIAFHYISVDKYVIKIDDVRLEGTSLAVGGSGTDLPENFAFSGNYPNPFNTMTSFRFDLVRPGPVHLTLFSASGREVAHVVDEFLGAGAHDISFDGSHLTSGMYFARLGIPGFSQTKKVILLK
jgi:hypothetical protein